MRRALRALWARLAPRAFLRWGRPDRTELGRLGEALAARALRRAGWRLLGRRLRTPAAEIDLVAAVGGELVCVEVKTGREPALPRRGAPRLDLRWRPGRRLDARRLARQRRAGRWLARRLSSRRTGPLVGGRVDLVEVWVRARPAGWRLVHHPDRRGPLAAGEAGEPLRAPPALPTMSRRRARAQAPGTDLRSSSPRTR